MLLSMINKIKQYITKKSISQTQFAKLIGTSKFTLSRWLNGHNKPSKAYEQIINKILN